VQTKTALALLAFLSVIPSVAYADRCSDGREREQRRRQREQPPATTSGPAAKPAADEQQQEEEVPVDEECIERNIYWMPGVFGTFFAPAASGLGPFWGAGVQFAPYQWSHNNDHFGPSQGSTFLQAALLTQPDGRGTLALFEAGGTASFERNSSRRWLIPYFGATFGGLTHSQLGTSAYAYPLGGLHLYWHRNLMLDAEGGYHFPFSDVDRARGPRAVLSARFSLW